MNLPSVSISIIGVMGPLLEQRWFGESFNSSRIPLSNPRVCFSSTFTVYAGLANANDPPPRTRHVNNSNACAKYGVWPASYTLLALMLRGRYIAYIHRLRGAGGWQKYLDADCADAGIARAEKFIIAK